jgi:hypothetical protein
MKPTRNRVAHIVSKLRDADGMLAAGRTSGMVCLTLKFGDLFA